MLAFAFSCGHVIYYATCCCDAKHAFLALQFLVGIIYCFAHMVKQRHTSDSKKSFLHKEESLLKTSTSDLQLMESTLGCEPSSQTASLIVILDSTPDKIMNRHREPASSSEKMEKLCSVKTPGK